ncbi:GNAT family N-acetyltransferase [Bacillus salitolerans]|uniref:GNAT family N-acetyltransferase n=1 Tax=Bacillus salitolerans TaxID=1437434 RepID=A0ABW4LUQ4_9BACI
MTFIVRKLSKDDGEMVYPIRQEAYRQNKGASSLIDKIDKDRMKVQLALVNRGSNMVIGYSLLWEQVTSPLIHRLEIQLHPDYKIVELLNMLYQSTTQGLSEIDSKAIQTRLLESQTYELEYFIKQGFLEDHRMEKVYLDLQDKSLNIHEHAQPNISITTLAKEKRVDGHYNEKLKELNERTWFDFPREALLPPMPPNDNWLHYENNIEEAFFIAKDGNQFIGYSHLCTFSDTSKKLLQGNTAVLGEFRGKGVATALKIEGIQYAQANGYEGIFTSHRNTNIPMNTVNEKLGWKRYVSEVRLQKLL